MSDDEIDQRPDLDKLSVSVNKLPVLQLSRDEAWDGRVVVGNGRRVGLHSLNSSDADAGAVLVVCQGILDLLHCSRCHLNVMHLLAPKLLEELLRPAIG